MPRGCGPMSGLMGRNDRQIRLGRAAAVVCTVASVVVIGLLMGGHMPFRTLEARAEDGRRGNGRWQMVHVLGQDCPCSTKVARHLLERARLEGLEERIVLVGVDDEVTAGLRAKGWRLERVTAEHARDLYGAQSAPLLVLVDGGGRIRYSGGYARRLDFRDGFREGDVWAELRAGREVKAMPAYGCALSFGCALGGVEEALAGDGKNQQGVVR